MTDSSPDRRKRSKWDDVPRDPRLNRDREHHLHRGDDRGDRGDRERSSGRSRWDDRRGETGHGHRERERDHPREDRRSRSPASSSRRRSRSPITITARSSVTPSADPVPKKAVDPAAAAGSYYLHYSYSHWRSYCIVGIAKLVTAAAAARINAQIQAKRGVQHVDVPPIRSVCFSTPISVIFRSGSG